MEQLARPGTTLLTGDTLRLAEGYVEVRPLGPVPVKGLAEPVEVFELVGAARCARGCRPRRRAASRRFVGRDARAGSACARRSSGPARATARSWRWSASPGVGKSRLFWEFTHRTARTAGSSWRARRCLLRQGARPICRSVDLLRDYFQIDERDDARAHPREGDGQAPHARRDAAAARCPPSSAARRADRRSGLAGARIRRSAAGAPRRGQARCSCARARCSRCSSSSRTSTGSTRRPRRSSTASWRACPTARILLLVELPARVPARLGRHELLHPAPLDPLPPASAEELLQALLGDRSGPPSRSSSS